MAVLAFVDLLDFALAFDGAFAVSLSVAFDVCAGAISFAFSVSVIDLFGRVGRCTLAGAALDFGAGVSAVFVSGDVPSSPALSFAATDVCSRLLDVVFGFLGDCSLRPAAGASASLVGEAVKPALSFLAALTAERAAAPRCSSALTGADVASLACLGARSLEGAAVSAFLGDGCSECC